MNSAPAAMRCTSVSRGRATTAQPFELSRRPGPFRESASNNPAQVGLHPTDTERPAT